MHENAPSICCIYDIHTVFYSINQMMPHFCVLLLCFVAAFFFGGGDVSGPTDCKVPIVFALRLSQVRLERGETWDEVGTYKER